MRTILSRVRTILVVVSGVGLVVSALAACNASASGEDKVMASAQSGLGSVKKGGMSLKLVGGAGETADGHDVGFSLEGPFDLSGSAGSLPKAKLTFTRLVGSTEQRTVFTSTGTQAFVESGGRTVELTGDQLRSLRLTKGKTSGGVAGFHLDRWATGRAKRTDGGRADGVAVDRVDADVDAVRALNDVFTLAGQFGSGVGPIEGAAAERLRKAVRASHVTVLVGKKDDLVRSLSLDVTFVADAAESLRQALGQLAAARLHLDLGITKPNQPIGAIAAP
ncbi:MAG: hypothetical protein QOK43_3039 [Acidimicrobiaceae bacterium]|nr:hypothetical protein [Acidimicrobiaceae bacterium]